MVRGVSREPIKPIYTIVLWQCLCCDRVYLLSGWAKLVQRLTSSTLHRYWLFIKYMKILHVVSENFSDLLLTYWWKHSILYRLRLHFLSKNYLCKHICSLKRYINAEVMMQVIHICQAKITTWAIIRRFTWYIPFFLLNSI